MVAAQQSLTTPATNTGLLTPVNPSQHVVSTRSDLISAIAYNLPPNYFEERDPDHGYRWFGVSQKSSFRTEIYLNAAKRRINISVFDNKGKTIKPCSSTLRMTGNWRRRLRRVAGEAVILINQRPDCPSCELPMVLKEHSNDHSQFFACSKFPVCTEALPIIDHVVDEATTADWTTSPQKERAYSSIAFNLPTNYYQVNDPKHDFHWFCQSQKTGFKARIHSTLHNARISISIFDRKGETVKEWSGDIQMVADWRTRLRRAAGEALVLVHQLRNCPVCHSAMEIRKRHHDQKQFFGCSKYPKCIGTMSITDYDATRKKAASHPANQSNENDSSI